jgi:two-component system, response regulator YesN
MSILSPDRLENIRESYARSYGIAVREFDCSGRLSAEEDYPLNEPSLMVARAGALREAVRWGEPYLYFALPNVIDWAVPIVKGAATLGGLSGGMVLPERSASDRLSAVDQLSDSERGRAEAEDWYDSLPVWSERARIQEASEFLFALTCCQLDWDMLLLKENRDKALRQRRIAEEIHRRKAADSGGDPLDQERALLALVQAGDKKGARGELNRMLGALFSHTADIRLIKAHIVEMMGHLVRHAVENNPGMSSLIEKNHRWMGAIIDADGFEPLADLIAAALEDFLDNVYLQSRGGTNETVARILSYLNDHYDEQVTLATLSRHCGLSTFRVAHLVKEITGNTVQEHIRRLRIQRAVELLVRSGQSCTEIAYALGYCDQSYFIKQFKRQMGITPSRYRRLYG